MKNSENNVKISIVMPVYNAQKTIAQTLDSLLNQTFEDYEIICVNDGSKDDSLKILEEYRNKNNKIKIINQENSGLAKARNIGIKSSNSKYIMFCDSDDKYEPTMIQEMYEAIEKEQTDFAMCTFKKVDVITKKAVLYENNDYYRTGFGKFNITLENLYNIHIVLWNKIIRREILEKNNIEYPLAYEHDDTMFMLRYFMSCKNYYVLDRPLYLYSVNNSNSIMGLLTNNKHGKKCYDFVFAMLYLFEYFESKEFSSEEYAKFFDFVAGCWADYYSRLLNKNKKQAREYIYKIIFEHKALFEKSERMSVLLKTQKMSAFNKVFFAENLSFCQKIFSVVNVGLDKYLILFGLKIRIKRKEEK